MKDVIAGFLIRLQNFNARFGAAVITVLIIAVAAFLIFTVVRTVLAGKYGEKKVMLRAKPADAQIKERAAESLQKMISFKTLSGNTEEMEKLCAFLRDNYPLTFKKGEAKIGQGGILLRLPAGKKTEKLPVLFCGHLDVVPAGEGWDYDPFAGVVDGGKIYGRGACDCKGPVVAMLEAAENLLKKGFCPRRDLWFAFGADEETGGEKGAESFARCLKEQGVYFDLVLDEGGYIAKSHLGREDFPAALIGVGEKQTCFCRLSAEARGGHSARPNGKTALGALAEAVCRIETANSRLRVSPLFIRYLKASMPALPFGKRYIVANLPLTRPLVKWAFKNNEEIAFMMKNSIVPTQVWGSAEESNMISARAECIIDVELQPSENGEKMLEYINKLLADLPVKAEMTLSETAAPVSNDDEMYKLLCRLLNESYPGLPCIEWISSGCSDGAHYGKISRSVLRFAPIVMESKTALSAHAPNERISCESLGAAVEIYMKMMESL